MALVAAKILRWLVAQRLRTHYLFPPALLVRERVHHVQLPWSVLAAPAHRVQPKAECTTTFPVHLLHRVEASRYRETAIGNTMEHGLVEVAPRCPKLALVTSKGHEVLEDKPLAVARYRELALGLSMDHGLVEVAPRCPKLALVTSKGHDVVEDKPLAVEHLAFARRPRHLCRCTRSTRP